MHDIAMAALSVFLMQSLAFLALPGNTCGPSAHLRAGRPRSRGLQPPIASTCLGRRITRIVGSRLIGLPSS